MARGRGERGMKLLMLSLKPARLIYQSIGLALVQIWANRTRSVLTTIGIIIGVASVTSVIAALSGLKAKVLGEFENFGSKCIYIWPQWPSTGPMKNASWYSIKFNPDSFDGLLEQCDSISGLCRMSYSRSPSVRFGDKQIDNIRASGIDSSWHLIMNRPIIMGREFTVIDQVGSRRVCIITPDLRDQLHLNRDPSGQAITIGRETFHIVGMVDKAKDSMFGGGEQKSYEIFVPFKVFVKPWRSITAVALAKSTGQAEEAKAEIQFFLRKVRHIQPGQPDTFAVETVESAINQFNTIAMVITMVAGSIVGISLLVGGVGIMNIMLVSVSERTREIGLRKAVGAKKSAILMQFLIEAIVLSLLGGIFGVILGQLITMGIASSSGLLSKTAIPFWAIAVSFLFSALVGIFFGMFPAIKAANLDPIEALRHE
jgi:putative ABC transport system permease protein